MNGGQHCSGRKPRVPAIEWQDWPRIQAGEYLAYCCSAVTYRDPGFHRHTCLLHWDVFGSDLMQALARLPMWLPLGKREKPRASRRGRYLFEWVRANNGPPVRADRLSPSVFKRRYARVLVNDNNSPVPYSVVTKIVRWETGEAGHSVNQSHSHGRPSIKPPESEVSRV